ncbi:hypothetical protein V1511DRAFT_503112 [Dipodascopsis uninucleata]
MASIISRSFAQRALLDASRSSRMSSIRMTRMSGLRRSVTSQSMTPTEAQEVLVKQRSHRPVSPHLTIYKPQISWILSGLHRLTGLVLAGGFYGLGLSYLFAPLFGLEFSSATLVSAFASLPVFAKVLVKTIAAAPFTFHGFNGIRHLVWDSTFLVNNKGVIRSGLAVIGLTAISTIGLLFI